MSQDFKVIFPSMWRHVGWLAINYQIKTNFIPWNLKSPLQVPTDFSDFLSRYCLTQALCSYQSLILHNSLNTFHVFPGSIFFVSNVPFFWILSLSLHIKILLIILQSSTQTPPLLPDFPFERNSLSLWIIPHPAVNSLRASDHFLFP